MREIHTIDLHYLGAPQAIAAYVVRSATSVVLIETGPASTIDQLEQGLAELGLELADVRHALVTHIHLDHAGAAGHLADNGTRIYVHEFGARHLIDPSRLLASASRIYGTQMDRMWGRMIPVPEALITPVHDGDLIELDGIEITAIETPGHARHHHAYAIDNVCFTGDIAGITLPISAVPEPPAGKFLTVPTPPPEFDLEAWRSSIDRLRGMEFSAIYLTHFGRRSNVAAHWELLERFLNDHWLLVSDGLAAHEPRGDLLAEYIEWNRRQAAAQGVSESDFSTYVSRNLLTMNLDGMARYWSQLAERGDVAEHR